MSDEFMDFEEDYGKDVDDEILKQSEKAKESGKDEKEPNGREPFDSAKYYMKKDQEKEKNS